MGNRGKVKDPLREKMRKFVEWRDRHMFIRMVSLVVGIMLAAGAFAGGEPAKGKGPVTNLPLPRFVSLKASEGNVRRGPSLTHRIDWVFKHEDMPLQVTAEFNNWRRVQDSEGQGGWMHYSLLSGVRTVVVMDEQAQIHIKPSKAAATRAYADRGVIARLGDCNPVWCEVSVQRVKGWVEKTQLWGVTADEIRE